MTTGIYTRITTIERFEKYYIKCENGCWQWTAFLDKDGYGQFWLYGKTRRAHRAGWFLYKGYWAKDLLCHHCDNPRCVNPKHLYEGTALTNQQDIVKRGRLGLRLLGAKPKKVCINGHIRPKERIGKSCLACVRIRNYKNRHTNGY